MTETVYIKRLASELPKESGYYHTESLLLYFDSANDSWVSHSGSGVKYQPNYWLEPSPQNISDVLKENEELKAKVGFYRLQTNVVRDFITEKNIGKPNQQLFQALADEFSKISTIEQQVSVLRETVEHAIDLLTDLGHGKHHDVEIYRQRLTALNTK